MPVANWPGLTNKQLVAFCWLPVHLLSSITASNRIGIWLAAASCLFSCHALKASQIDLASRCRLLAANSPGRTNWKQAFFCRWTIYMWFLYSSLKSNLHLTASCQLPFLYILPVCIWLPFASCLFNCYGFKVSQILIWQLTASCQLPNRQDGRIRLLQKAHNVKMMSYWCDVVKLHRRQNNVISTSCDCWVASAEANQTFPCSHINYRTFGTWSVKTLISMQC